MSLLMMEAFAENRIAPSQPIGASGNKIKQSSSGLNQAPKNGLECFRISKGTTAFYTLGSNENATVILGHKFFREDTSPNDGGWKFYGDDGATCHASILINGTEGYVAAYRGDFASGGTLLGSASNKWFWSTWHHWEFRLVCNDTTGAVKIAIDGTTVLDLTSQDTKNGGADALIDKIEWVPGSGDDGYNLRDIVVMNGAGSAFNDMIGPATVGVMKPNGAGAVSGWTPTSGANYTTVDEVTVSTADYNSAGSTALADSYAMEDWPFQVDPAAVAVTVFAIAISGTMGLKGRVRHSSTNADHGTTLTPTAGYATWQWIWETDPIAAAAWTKANLNAAEAGMVTV